MAKKKSSGKRLVIVESPTKARTIKKFLGKNYMVESCMGHIRDLPQSAREIPEKLKKEPWAKLGVNVDKGFEPLYCIPKNKTKIVTKLRSLAKEADEVLLATDEDREGESISWHLKEVLKLKGPVKRMVFHEITKNAIEEALEAPRNLNENLVRAQEARRILDRLVGYTISPLLWKKIAYGLSAGRVQSVAIRLISGREDDRFEFHKSSYWGATAKLEKGGKPFESRLTQYKGKKIAVGKDFDGTTGKLKEGAQVLHLQEKDAAEIVAHVGKSSWSVAEVEEKPVTRRPAPPFITSTLQQDASRKFSWGSAQTMRVAQGLYEKGFITYMRTDSTALSEQAVKAARKRISKLYGKDYLPDQPRTYKHKKVKGAQEAHEAIRPAGTEFVPPEETGLSGDEFKLYDLIWKRTAASQMADAKQLQVAAKIKVGEAIFNANGMTIQFPGFLRAYVEGSDDADAALMEREVQLPVLKSGDSVQCSEVQETSHETKPPARFTEASLIQTMEKLGIGRPSTYAPTISTVINRGYVVKNGNALVPTFTALIVVKLLNKYLPQYVDSEFTSEMEKSLDDIADGDMNWAKYLGTVYLGKNGLRTQVESQEKRIEPEEARSIKFAGMDGLDFRVGRYGAYVCRMDQETGEEVCASLPETQAPADITSAMVDKLIEQKISGGDAMGKDPKTGESIYLLTGRYGPYVQRGESAGDGVKPKRMAIPAGVEPEDVDFKLALDLLSLPKTLGPHPETEKDVNAGIGRFGPFVVHDGDFRSIPKTESVFDVTFERAMELLSQPKRGRGRAKAIKELGAHPGDGEAVGVFSGKYGPYVKWGKVNASVPEGEAPEELTLTRAVELLDAKGGGSSKAKKKKAKKASSKKVKKKTAKKTAKKKAKKTAKKKSSKKK